MLPIRECTVVNGNFHSKLTSHKFLTFKMISSDITIKVDWFLKNLNNNQIANHHLYQYPPVDQRDVALHLQDAEMSPLLV